jgi:hypothetical protein
MREFGAEDVSILDRGFVDAFEANDSLRNDLLRDQSNPYVQSRIKSYQEKLKKLISD